MTDAPWNEDRVRSFLAENEFSYQNVDLPYGLRTGGHDRRATAAAILPGDLTGKSVLDVGCMYGYFCFEAESRGAERIVGVDIDPENVAKCRQLAEIKGSGCEFRQLDIERDSLDRSFDYVLCLNVLHHLRNPLSVLDRLVSMTDERLVLEVASFSRKDRRKNRVPSLLGALLNRLPIIYLGGARPNAATQTFFFTPKALRVLLSGHRATFGKVEFHRQGHKGRYLAIAHKRRIEHLVVIAGVPASGKSTFIGRLLAGELGSVADATGFDARKSWGVRGFGTIAGSEAELPANLVLHYNITKHLIDGDIYRHDRALLDLMQVAERVTVLTLWCPPVQLAERYRARRDDTPLQRFLSRRAGKKRRVYLGLYENEARLRDLFSEWFAFVERHVADAHVVASTDEPRLLETGQWKRECVPAAGGGPSA